MSALSKNMHPFISGCLGIFFFLMLSVWNSQLSFFVKIGIAALTVALALVMLLFETWRVKTE
jgi:hypothetical protein